MNIEYYNQIKAFIAYQLEHRDYRIKIDCPAKWAATFLPLLTKAQADEDYEAAKAIKDAIKEFLNRFLPEGEKITDETTLKLPEYTKKPISGIICFVDENGDSYAEPFRE